MLIWGNTSKHRPTNKSYADHLHNQDLGENKLRTFTKTATSKESRQLQNNGKSRQGPPTSPRRKFRRNTAAGRRQDNPNQSIPHNRMAKKNKPHAYHKKLRTWHAWKSELTHTWRWVRHVEMRQSRHPSPADMSSSRPIRGAPQRSRPASAATAPLTDPFENKKQRAESFKSGGWLMPDLPESLGRRQYGRGTDTSEKGGWSTTKTSKQYGSGI